MIEDNVIKSQAKSKLQIEYEPEKVNAIATYLALVLDKSIDTNCRLSHWHSSRICAERASAQHSLNLMWCYPEVSGDGNLWESSAKVLAPDYTKLCELFGIKSNSTTIPGFVGAFRETALPDINIWLDIEVTIRCVYFTYNIG